MGNFDRSNYRPLILLNRDALISDPQCGATRRAIICTTIIDTSAEPEPLIGWTEVTQLAFQFTLQVQVEGATNGEFGMAVTFSTPVPPAGPNVLGSACTAYVQAGRGYCDTVVLTDAFGKFDCGCAVTVIVPDLSDVVEFGSKSGATNSAS